MPVTVGTFFGSPNTDLPGRRPSGRGRNRSIRVRREVPLGRLQSDCLRRNLELTDRSRPGLRRVFARAGFALLSTEFRPPQENRWPTDRRACISPGIPSLRSKQFLWFDSTRVATSRTRFSFQRFLLLRRPEGTMSFCGRGRVEKSASLPKSFLFTAWSGALGRKKYFRMIREAVGSLHR